MGWFSLLDWLNAQPEPDRTALTLGLMLLLLAVRWRLRNPDGALLVWRWPPPAWRRDDEEDGWD